MELPPTRANRLLLVEDWCGDAKAVKLCLSAEGTGDYEISVVDTLGAAIGHLEREKTDIVLLDLTLPDSAGLETLTRLYAVAAEVPIVVLTGSDDERLALCCIQAGAQDYLCKSDMTPHTLRRALGYALGRVREAQLQSLRMMVHSCRPMSSQQLGTRVTQSLAGLRPIKDRNQEALLEMQTTYCDLLEGYLEHLRTKTEKPRDHMEIMVTKLGDLGATPRDLIDVHLGALELVSRKIDQSQILYFASDGRLFVLEMMGLLVEYYRLGFRRVFPERAMP